MPARKKAFCHNNLCVLLTWTTIAALCLYLSFNIHSQHRLFTYKSPMWADNAGYYMYLPAAFIYNFDAQAFPEHADSLTGDGFRLQQNGCVYTKYTSGVAMMQLPFFLITHALCRGDGFSQPYVNMMLVSGVFYLLLGMFFLYRALRLTYSKPLVILSLLVLFAATNLYYYGLERNGMSHVYSFCLCSIALYIILSKGISVKSILWLVPLAAMVVLIRPINILMIPLWFLATGKSMRIIFSEIRSVFSFKLLLYTLFVPLLIFLPQLLYWRYLCGGAIMYSYKHESFIYWKNPKILEVLFSPNNGFLLYCPLALLCMAGWLYMKRLYKTLVIALFATLLILTYITASWWSWDFGCSYGQRNYIDYYPFFAFGLVSLFAVIKTKKKALQVVTGVVCLLFIFYNLSFIYNYDDCFSYGTWNYRAWWEILRK